MLIDDEMEFGLAVHGVKASSDDTLLIAPLQERSPPLPIAQDDQ
jgi:hypothetical protein